MMLQGLVVGLQVGAIPSHFSDFINRCPSFGFSNLLNCRIRFAKCRKRARPRFSFPGAPKRSQHRAFSFVPKPKILQQRSGSQSRPLGDGAFDGLWMWMSTATVPSLKSAYSDGGNKVLDVVGLKFFCGSDTLARLMEGKCTLALFYSLSVSLSLSVYLSLSLSLAPFISLALFPISLLLHTNAH